MLFASIIERICWKKAVISSVKNKNQIKILKGVLGVAPRGLPSNTKF